MQEPRSPCAPHQDQRLRLMRNAMENAQLKKYDCRLLGEDGCGKQAF
jgi:hypothetical protein